MHIQYTTKSGKWCLKTLKSVQNEVPRGIWSHQNKENVEKVKSNENTTIYYTFDRLGHQKSADFPLKNHQKSCLQSKHVFWCLTWQEISKSDPKWFPEAPQMHQKSMKIQPGTFQGPSLCICDPLGCKMVPTVCPNDHLETLKGVKKSITQHITNRFPFFIFINWFQSWKQFFLFLLILSVCKSAVNWSPEGPAAGAKPSE